MSFTHPSALLDIALAFIYIQYERKRIMAKTLTMRLDDETYETFVRAARSQRRSLANLIETAALHHLEESNFADDAEMAEIISRPELVRRMKAGSRDARKRRGRFVSSV